MECEEFLRGYSEYADGLRGPEELRRFDGHLARCRACARYDRIVKQGTDMFRRLPRAGASADFLPRLRHRLYHIDDHHMLGMRPGGSAALVAIAAVGLLALAWLPFASRIPVEVELAPVAAVAPTVTNEIPSLFSDGPFVAPVAFQGRGLSQPVTVIWSEQRELFEPTLVQAGLASQETALSQ